jgi:hypothetical protein
MDYNLETSNGIPSLYKNFNTHMVHGNPTMLVILTVVIIFYYIIFSKASVADVIEVTPGPQSGGLRLIEIVMWAMFIFLILINGLQYFFEVDITASIKKIFTPEPEIDINVISSKDEEDPVPEIKIEKQVFHIPDNKYTYEESKALCKAYGGRLANYDEIETAYQNGAEWCGYGWSKDQLALFPTQKASYDKLQKIEGHENDCGRPGINGGFIENPKVRFGVNCYGYKPEITREERDIMNETSPYPVNEKDKRFEKMVQHYKKKLPDILVAPFNNTRWSVI